MFKKRLLPAAAGAMFCLSGLAQAASGFYVVIPLQNRAPTTGNILVTLNAYTLPAGIIGRAYAGFDFNSVLQVKGDPSYAASSVRWAVAGGALPTGLTLGADGKLSGTPTAPGTSSFQVMASYKTKAGQQAYQVMVADVSVALAAATLPDGEEGIAYTYDLKPLLAVTGDPEFTLAQVSWTVNGTLPAGLQLNSDGTITGTPTTGGTNSFDVTATYRAKQGAHTYSVNIAAVSITIADASLSAYQGSSYSYNLKNHVSVSAPNYSSGKLNLSLTGAPAGVSFNASTGVLSGTPAQGGSFPLKLTATYDAKSVQKDYTLTVNYYRSCADFLANNAGAPSGWYTLDVDGAGAAPAQSYYCDMVSDGGGWTRVVRQTEAETVTNWNGGVNGNSYALADAVIPTHTQVAFGKDESATALDYVNWHYTAGDIATTTVTSPKTGKRYQIHRNLVQYYRYNEPEFSDLRVDWSNTAGWDNTLLFDVISGTVGTPDYTWSFAPLNSTPSYRGYAFGGVSLVGTPSSFAWTVWVR